MTAPIALFAYNRLDLLRATITALQNNLLAEDSDLYVFSDGPKVPEDARSIVKIREYLKTVDGFRKVSVQNSDVNKGLAASIIGGVTEIVNRYDSVIVLEDDIVTSPFFLKFMNDALHLYKNEEGVMSISGYMYPHKEELPSTFFFNLPLCWGWATWKRAWDHYDGAADPHIDYLNRTRGWKEFNKVGGRYLERQLWKNQRKQMNTWFIFWHASIFRRKGFCLYPGLSLVNNIGFNGIGDHAGFSHQYQSPLATSPIPVERQALQENVLARAIIRRHYLLKVNSYARAIGRFLTRFLGRTSQTGLRSAI